MNEQEPTILNEPFIFRVDKNGDVTVEPEIQGATTCTWKCMYGKWHYCCQTPNGERCYPTNAPC